MVCKWTGLWSSKAEVMVNHMDNRQSNLETYSETKARYEIPEMVTVPMVTIQQKCFQVPKCLIFRNCQ